MGMDPDAAWPEFLEDGRVFANEINGAGGDAEGVSVLGDDGYWEGFGRL